VCQTKYCHVTYYGVYTNKNNGLYTVKLVSQHIDHYNGVADCLSSWFLTNVEQNYLILITDWLLPRWRIAALPADISFHFNTNEDNSSCKTTVVLDFNHHHIWFWLSRLQLMHRMTTAASIQYYSCFLSLLQLFPNTATDVSYPIYNFRNMATANSNPVYSCFLSCLQLS
jgi:hypothetical protein